MKSCILETNVNNSAICTKTHWIGTNQLWYNSPLWSCWFQGIFRYLDHDTCSFLLSLAFYFAGHYPGIFIIFIIWIVACLTKVKWIIIVQSVCGSGEVKLEQLDYLSCKMCSPSLGLYSLSHIGYSSDPFRNDLMDLQSKSCEELVCSYLKNTDLKRSQFWTCHDS